MKVLTIFFMIISLMTFLSDVYSAELKDAAGIWLFDEGSGNTATDSSKNGNHGKIIVPEWTSGKFGKALQFNGDGTVVNIPDSKSLDLEDEVTIVAWVNAGAPKLAWPNIVSKGADVTPENYALFISTADKFLHFPMNPGGPRTFVNSPNGSFELGKWQHAAATYDGKSGKIYVNGKKVVEETRSGKLVPNNMIFRIGNGGALEQAYWWYGVMDEVAIFNKALSEQEIKEIMENGVRIAIGLGVEPMGKLAVTWGIVKKW
jgi:hypothetical protein